LLLLPATLKRFHLLPFSLNPCPDLSWKRCADRRRGQAVAMLELFAAAAGTRLISPNLPHPTDISSRQSSINLWREWFWVSMSLLSRLPATLRLKSKPEAAKMGLWASFLLALADGLSAS